MRALSYKYTSSLLCSWVLIFTTAMTVSNFNFQILSATYIRDTLKTSDFMLQFSLILGPLLAIISNMFIGAISDHCGRRKPFLCCLIFFFLGTLLCGIAPNIETFLLGRVFQVLGDAGMSILVFSIFSDMYPSKELAWWLGAHAIVTALIGIMAPLIGAWLLSYYTWRTSFFLAFCMSGTLTIYLGLFLPETLGDQRGVSYTSPLTLLKGGLLLLKIPAFSYSCLIPALNASILALFDYYGPFFYIDACHFSSQAFSFIRAGLTLTGIVGSSIYMVYISRRATGLQKSLKMGALIHIFYTLGTGYMFIKHIHHPILFFILFAIHILGTSFIAPSSLIQVLSSAGGHKGLGLSIQALVRNVLSACITFILASYGFSGDLDVLLFLIFILSLIIIGLLVKVFNLSQQQPPCPIGPAL